jgi:hypothetical protein
MKIRLGKVVVSLVLKFISVDRAKTALQDDTYYGVHCCSCIVLNVVVIRVYHHLDGSTRTGQGNLIFWI